MPGKRSTSPQSPVEPVETALPPDVSRPEERAPASVSKGEPVETNPSSTGPGGRVGDSHEAEGPDRNDWQTLLRSQGYRLTPQRQLVLGAVETLGHATPDEVFAEVREHSSSVNLSTVYRTLDLLDQLGLIRHAHLSDRAPTYHSVKGQEHAHFVCRACRRSFAVGEGDVQAALGGLAAAYGFKPDYGHLTVFGVCIACAGR